MQEVQSRQRQRRRDEAQSTGIIINNFKDFLNSKLDFKLPEGYATFSHQQKIETWKGLLDRLKNQTQKLSYQLPDYWKEEQVNLITQTINENNEDKSFDFEYEEMFLGNKKQLVVYKKCREMDQYLEKYRLPKNYDPFLKQVQNVSKVIFDLKIKRNIAISVGNKEELDQLNQQMTTQTQLFDEKFKKFQDLMRKVFEHFKQQKKRTLINLEIIRQSIYQKLKPLAAQLQLNIFPRYPDIENEEFLFIQITKKNEFDKYFDTQNLEQEQKLDENPISDDESSYVSDQSEEQKELALEEIKRKALPPAGVYDIKFEKYQKPNFILRISFQTCRNKFETPKILEYGQSEQFQHKIEITNPMKDLQVSIPIQKGGYICTYFRTRNDFGNSQTKKFRYFLNLDQEMNSIKNGNLYLIGQDKYLIPQQRTKKINNLNLLTLAVSDFSISSSHVEICDFDGNAADWGLFKKIQVDKKQDVVEQNAIFKIVNNSSNMFYQEPAIRLDKNYQIVKCSSGSGYGMMLDKYGAVWVFGKNNCGQLGMKDELSDEDPVKIKFFEDRKIFITDIKATQSLASFAIDSNGQLYKWGLNQFYSTNEPIFDRFGKIINYSLQNYFQQQWTPLPVKKHFDSEKIVQISAGNQFYFILNNQGTLYGWGQCRNLGKGVLKDGKDQQIDNICNDIEIMKNVVKISAGKDHAVAITKQGEVFGWGRLDSISNEKKGFSENMVNLAEQYGKVVSQDLLCCGPSYTCIYKASQEKIRLFGDISKFTESKIEIKQKVRKIECGENVIGILCQK